MNCPHCEKELVVKKSFAGYDYCARCGSTIILGDFLKNAMTDKVIGYTRYGEPVFAARKTKPKKAKKPGKRK